MSVIFKDNSAAVKQSMEQAIEKSLEMIGLKAEEYAKLACPVDTGNLRNSIGHDHDSDSAYVGTSVEYASYVEFGTSRMAAQPYLKPAAFEHLDEYKQIVKSNMQNN